MSSEFDRIGVGPAVAVRCLLAFVGKEVTHAEIRERIHDQAKEDSILRCLQGYGVSARIVNNVQRNCRVNGPSLALRNDGSWIVIKCHKRKLYGIEAEYGLVWVSLEEISRQVVVFLTDVVSVGYGGGSIRSVCRSLLDEHKTTLTIHFFVPSVLLLLASVVGPELQGKVLGQVLPDSARSQLYLIAVLIFLVGIFSAMLGLVRDKAVLSALARSDFKLKTLLLERILRNTLADNQSRSLGEQLQGFAGVSAARTILSERVLGAFVDGFLAIGFLVAIALKSPDLMLASLAAAFLVAIFTFYVGKQQERLQALEIKAQSSQRGYFAEAIAGIRQVKSSGAGAEIHRKWVGKLREELGLNLRRQRSTLVSEIGNQMVQSLLSMTVMLWAASSTLKGEISVGSFFVIVLLNDRFIAAVIGSANSYLALVALRIQLVETNKGLERGYGDVVQASPLRGPVSLKVKDLSFKYSTSDSYVIEKLSLEVDRNGFFKLCGASGRGKSTLLKLLAGLYEPSAGLIRINGRDPATARESILYLPQFFQLYRGSILDNLLLLGAGASVGDIERAAKSTGLDDQIKNFPMGYETQLSHGGQTLSGGQRQMLALTAVIASDRQILLLDEPMANLDSVAARKYMDLFLSLDKIVIYAGHEPYSVQAADVSEFGLHLVS